MKVRHLEEGTWFAKPDVPPKGLAVGFPLYVLGARESMSFGALWAVSTLTPKCANVKLILHPDYHVELVDEPQGFRQRAASVGIQLPAPPKAPRPECQCMGHTGKRKRRFTTQRSAMSKAIRYSRKAPARTYQCPTEPGVWHVTTRI